MVSSLADTRKKNVSCNINKFLGGKYAFSFLNVSKYLQITLRYPLVTTKMWAMANDPSFVEKLKKDRVGSGSWVYMKFLRTLFEAHPEKEPEDFSDCPLFVFST